MSGPEPGQGVHARVVVVADEEHTIATIGATQRCDLALVDQILHLCLVAGRLGWEIELRDVDDRLAELMTLVGLPTTPAVRTARRR